MLKGYLYYLQTAIPIGERNYITNKDPGGGRLPHVGTTGLNSSSCPSAVFYVTVSLSS